ncbi:hypothetical protein GCM10011575_29310 [Microlunatus endophyticus]|uniref:Lipopolysaccharide assembly protein A domain-containing protein n=1 Tax=Microlunatus endophyticus TaxID=1716077 RepID=A0A917W6N2_9ACTN|nr:lipopolysaccharide assembly protein LapA domain-containing protein [Microlunatus endophyticus]GGL68805.1 hypothetical protein GCM10011575_29310 [Microlunatus endophyticus]
MANVASQGPRAERTGPRVTPRQVIAGVLIVLAVIFIIENRERVEIRLIVPLVSMPLWAVMTVLFVMGGVAGWLLARRSAARRDRR